jgi:predicted DNA-binding transcriptional regulator AlpA
MADNAVLAPPEVACRLLNIKQVAYRLAISERSVYRLLKAGSLARPVRVGPRSPRWRLADIAAFIEAASGNGSHAD